MPQAFEARSQVRGDSGVVAGEWRYGEMSDNLRSAKVKVRGVLARTNKSI